MLNLFLWTNTPSVTAYDKHVEMCTGGRGRGLVNETPSRLGVLLLGVLAFGKHTFAGELVACISLYKLECDRHALFPSHHPVR
jgi:hypothetical protein